MSKSVPSAAVLIVNTCSRQGKQQFDAARGGLTAAGIELIAAHAVDDPRLLDATLRAAISDGAPMIILGGGDGTLSALVDQLVGQDIVLAVLPLGTANSFARSLGIPLSLDQAIDAIATGQRQRIDLGQIDGDYFTNCAAMGLSPMIGSSVPQWLKTYFGRVGYLAWAVRCFAIFRPFRVTITDDRGPHQMWASEVRILNGCFHGGVVMSDAARIDSGQLLVQVVSGRNRWRLAWDWYARFFRLRTREKMVREFRGTSLKLDARPRHRIAIDGEVAARVPVTLRAVPGAIDVVVPRQSPTLV